MTTKKRRLTKQIKSYILRSALKAAYEPRVEELGKVLLSIGNRKIATAFKNQGYNLDAIRKLDSDNQGFFGTSKNIFIENDIKNNSVFSRFTPTNPSEIDVALKNCALNDEYQAISKKSLPTKRFPAPFFITSNQEKLKVSLKDSEIEKVISVINGYKKLKKDLVELDANLNALLSSVSTVESFLEKWPEGSVHVPEEQEKPKLPAVDYGKLVGNIECSIRGNCDA
uniref:Nucleotide modification associated domain-containing protein n=1 Tax=Hydrogenovibrio crunogenus (strain DSM 25203 / XCL-2) TaxID=317025 RepID=Q31HW8_HYDCU